MGIIPFPLNGDVGFINGEVVIKPTTSSEYLAIVKRFLEKDDYEEILCSILDKDYYDNAEDQLKSIVDFYYSF